ncbi:DUF547 domain-containing protein [Aestuariivivens sediminis]|uniref:DUF547 domain-containing protein n=1 Tax=Aestuariivivens sediminis TaxID=2913557 RepID=UPI001F5977C8|nr:DUF547 domain-containing protein [Aestuariivivens sediminis]
MFCVIRILHIILLTGCWNGPGHWELRSIDPPTPLTLHDPILKINEGYFIQESNNAAKPMPIGVKTIGPGTDQNPQKPVVMSHKSWDTLLKKHVSEDGAVDYEGFKTDWKALSDYLEYLGQNVPQDSWSKEEQLSFWINAYNAMTVDLILRHYPVKSIKDIKQPWKQRLWKVGTQWYHLNAIEHEVLRNMNEPRIHFALVCASRSCPRLRNAAYTASTLEDQLQNVTREFLTDPEKNTISQNRLELSKLFQWYTKDFKKHGGLIDFLNQYVDIPISDKATLTYKDYDWGLNK